MLLTLSSRKRCHVLLCRLPKRRRRRRISITAGEESEANGTCGKTSRNKTSSKRANISKLKINPICSASLRTILLHPREDNSSLFTLLSSLISLVLLVIFNCGVNVFLHRLCAERSACAAIDLGLLCQLLGFRELKVVVERQQKLLDA